MQTQIPFLVWMGSDVAQGFDSECLAGTAREETHSRDNLFHSVLGLMGVSTSVYDRDLDVFSNCRKSET
nr:hypothetical protein [Sinorhizobium sp. 8-89]